MRYHRVDATKGEVVQPNQRMMVEVLIEAVCKASYALTRIISEIHSAVPANKKVRQ